MLTLRFGVPASDRLQRARGEPAVHLRDVFRLGDHYFGDQINEAEQLLGGAVVIADVELPRVNGIVAYHSNDIQGLLDAGVKALLNQGCDIVVDVLSLLAQLLTELLYSKSKQSSRPTR